jgi:hypothetical protein
MREHKRAHGVKLAVSDALLDAATRTHKNHCKHASSSSVNMPGGRAVRSVVVGFSVNFRALFSKMCLKRDVSSSCGKYSKPKINHRFKRSDTSSSVRACTPEPHKRDVRHLSPFALQSRCKSQCADSPPPDNSCKVNGPHNVTPRFWGCGCGGASTCALDASFAIPGASGPATSGG